MSDWRPLRADAWEVEREELEENLLYQASAAATARLRVRELEAVVAKLQEELLSR